MKKLLVTMLTILASGAAYALPVGNPSEASLLCDGLFWEGNCCADPCDPCASWCDAFSFRFGFYGDYVFNRHLEIRNNDGEGRDIEHTELYTNAGYLALNAWNRVDVFATLGTTNLFLNTNAAIFTGGETSARFEIETNSKFSWSVGARGTLWECGCTALGIEGQYFQTKTDIKRATFAAVTSVYPSGDEDITYKEWQVGLGLSHRINMFVPYIAVKWSRAHWNFDNFTSIFSIPDLRSDKNWGYAVGVSLVDCEKAALTVEGRFADEKAVYVNGQIRF